MSKKVKKLRIDGESCQMDRHAEGLNQSDYWRRFGVTQSGASRYEAGRTMPRPLRMLVALANGKATVEQLQDGTLAEMV